MAASSSPELILTAAEWTFSGYPTPEAPWTRDQKLAAVKQAGFDAITCPADGAELKELLAKHGLRHTGGYFFAEASEAPAHLAACRELGDGPVNVQLGHHDTPVEEAVPMIEELMREGERLGVDVHIETHRARCTETPEKIAAILKQYRERNGKYPRLNFDFSHPAVVKHLSSPFFEERLFDFPEVFQASSVWHMRPFNGHHCQIPITDGRGNFSPEYEQCRPFVRAAMALWLAGPPPRGRLWVVPELGPVDSGYGLSCFPDVWEDAVVLGRDLRAIWAEELGKL
ncbi:MAG: xylose isomerase [Verrucomicrobiota bacterium]